MSNDNIYPYFDDFDSNKNYHKILFKPGYSVQARELTQLQSILSNQIESIGKNLFPDNSPIVNGEISITSRSYVEVNETNIDLFEINEIVENTDKTIKAKIVYIEDNKIFIKYIKGSNLDSTLVTRDYTIEIIKTGFGILAHVNAGIYFVDGKFIKIEAHDTLLSIDENYTGSIFLKKESNYISSDEDDTLLDPARGFPNFNAPGSDRKQIKLSITGEEDTNTIELVYVENNKFNNTTKSGNSYIFDILAKRTFEESGNYSVKPFIIRLNVRSTDDIYELNISTGKVYVNGQSIETKSNQIKNRNIEYITHQSKLRNIYMDDMPFIFVKSENAIPKIFDEITITLTTNTTITTKLINIFKFGNTYKFFIIPWDTINEDNGKLKLISGAEILSPYVKNLKPSSMIYEIPEEYTTRYVEQLNGFPVIEVDNNTINKSNQSMTLRNKTLDENTEEVLLVNERYELSHSDIFEFVEIDGKELESFECNNGITSYEYKNGYIRYKGEDGAPTSIEVTYKYFEHSSGDYFSINSYPGLDVIPRSTDDQGTESIVSYKKYFKYRNMIDFRYSEGKNQRTYNLVDDFDIDFLSYLDKVDSLIINKDGDFEFVNGQYNIVPEVSEISYNEMLLAHIRVKGFINNEDDIIINYPNNKRYTMSDINLIDSKVKTISDEISTSILEQDIISRDISNIHGESLSKTSILVDDFRTFKDQGNISINEDKEELYREFDLYNDKFNNNQYTGMVSRDDNKVLVEYETNDSYIDMKGSEEALLMIYPMSDPLVSGIHTNRQNSWEIENVGVIRDNSIIKTSSIAIENREKEINNKIYVRPGIINFRCINLLPNVNNAQLYFDNRHIRIDNKEYLEIDNKGYIEGSFDIEENSYLAGEIDLEIRVNNVTKAKCIYYVGGLFNMNIAGIQSSAPIDITNKRINQGLSQKWIPSRDYTVDKITLDIKETDGQSYTCFITNEDGVILPYSQSYVDKSINNSRLTFQLRNPVYVQAEHGYNIVFQTRNECKVYSTDEVSKTHPYSESEGNRRNSTLAITIEVCQFDIGRYSNLIYIPEAVNGNDQEHYLISDIVKPPRTEININSNNNEIINKTTTKDKGNKYRFELKTDNKYVSPQIDIERLSSHTINYKDNSIYYSNVGVTEVPGKYLRIYLESQESPVVYCKTDAKTESYIGLPSDIEINEELFKDRKISFGHIDGVYNIIIDDTVFCTGVYNNRIYFENPTSNNLLFDDQYEYFVVNTNAMYADIDEPEQAEVLNEGTIFTYEENLYITKEPLEYNAGELSNRGLYEKLEWVSLGNEVKVIKTDVDWVECILSNRKGTICEYSPTRLSQKGFNQYQVKIEIPETPVSRLQIVSLV
jgi:hypothetical protein